MQRHHRYGLAGAHAAVAPVFVAGAAYEKAPDLKAAVQAGLPILEAARKLRK